MLYPKYMIVNKTKFDIFYNQDKWIKKKNNDFIIGDIIPDKIKFKVKSYQESQPIDLSNIGAP